jgi:hypothetical protein
MNGKLSSNILLYFFAIMFLAVIGCSKSDDSPATTFLQEDLMGTWNFQILKTDGSSTHVWQRFNAIIDSSGNFSAFLDCWDSDGGSTCPDANSITWTIDASGVITESGASGNANAHYNLASNKKFVAGTGGSASPYLLIAQRGVSGTSYTNADVENQTFVIHELMAGSDNIWTYASGSTDSARTMNLSSQTTPSGTTVPGDVGIIGVHPGGFVTIDTLPSYRGFISNDKKTIVGTYTDGGNYHLMVIQITTGQTTTAGAVPDGTLYGHMLALGASPAPFWAHYTSAASSGTISYNNVVSSSPSVTSFGSVTGATIGTTGDITFSGTGYTYHGQQSYDGYFVVGTETMNSTRYLMTVEVK